ncbi:MAG TPA: hypothetical protein VNT23_08475, partial [Gaiellaceae bacterium]|nr:hypothetical protein [Gaiellaceae bacterium]
RQPLRGLVGGDPLALEDPSAFMVGTAVVAEAEGGTTTISISMDDDSGRAAELRDGECWTGEKGRVVQELGAIENRQLEATVDQPLADMLEAEYALVVVGEGGEDVGCSLVGMFGAGSQ